MIVLAVIFHPFLFNKAFTVSGNSACNVYLVAARIQTQHCNGVFHIRLSLSYTYSSKTEESIFVCIHLLYLLFTNSIFRNLIPLLELKLLHGLHSMTVYNNYYI